MRGQQRQGSATCACTIGKRHSIGPLPPRTGNAPNVLSRFSLTMEGRDLLSPMSQAAAWPDNSIGLTGRP
jgi:hypothetical protein